MNLENTFTGPSVFLMHRVELKVYPQVCHIPHTPSFLMHRVELKAFEASVVAAAVGAVPNAPCGVERRTRHSQLKFKRGFLMHRVELKELARVCL